MEMNSEISSKPIKAKAKGMAVDDSCVMRPSLVAAAKTWRNFAKESNNSVRSSPYSQSLRYYSKTPVKSYNRQFVPLDISRSNLLQLVTKSNNITKQGNTPSEKLQLREKPAKNKKLIISPKESDASFQNENITLRKINMMTRGRAFANDTKSSSPKKPKGLAPKPIVEDRADTEFDEVFENAEKQFRSNTLVTDYPIYAIHEIDEPLYNAEVMELRSVAPQYMNRAVIYDVIQTFEQVIHSHTALVIHEATINETVNYGIVISDTMKDEMDFQETATINETVNDGIVISDAMKKETDFQGTATIEETVNDEKVILDAIKDETDFQETAKDELIILLGVKKNKLLIEETTEDGKLPKESSVAEISYQKKSCESEADKRDMPSFDCIIKDSNQKTEKKILILYNVIFVFAFLAVSCGELFSFI